LFEDGGAFVVGGMDELITAAAIVAVFYSQAAGGDAQLRSI
jgi:hypothetical protein